MTPAGWYPDAQSDEVIRYWDGTQWTEERAWDGAAWVVRPLGTPVVAAPPPEPPPPADAAPPVDPPPPPDAVAPPVEPAPPRVAPPAEPDLPVAPAAAAMAAETVVGAPEPVEVPAPASASAPPAATVPPHAALPEAAPLAPAGSGESVWRRPAALVALGLVVAVGSGAITYFLRKDDSEVAAPVTPSSTGLVPTRPPRSTSTSTISTSTTSTTVPLALTPVIGTVARTCGAGGHGDCFVSVRSAPDGNAPEVRRQNDGTPIAVVCQVPGSAAFSSVLNRNSTAWTRLSDGTFVASIYVDAVGFDPLSIQRPCP